MILKLKKTKEQKLEACKRVLERFRKIEPECYYVMIQGALCMNIAIALYGEIIPYKDMYTYFPEFYKFMPEGNSYKTTWWGDTNLKSRIEYLEKIVQYLEGLED